ncbi:efflux RND transporter permease subunit, partial [Acidobacteriota bacterium]
MREGSRKLLVRVMGDFESLDQIRRLPIGHDGLRLKDVADVDFDYPRQEDFNYLNGSESLSMRVYKASNANLIAVVDQVREEIGHILEMPEAEGLDIQYYFDSSKDVRKGIAELRNTGLIGGVLAIIFMFFFLRRVRTTLLVAIAIPISIIVTFVIMYLSRKSGITDITINLMTLMGLMLAIGMLVDNSIVVIESIFRHRHDLGKDARSASLVGASELALPIIASTLTTICVFLPLIFLQGGGHFSRYTKSIGTTVCIVMSASLIVALTVAPMVAAILLKIDFPIWSP